MTALVPVSEAIQIVAAETDVVTETPVQERTGDVGNEDETGCRRRRGGRIVAVGMPMPETPSEQTEMPNADTETLLLFLFWKRRWLIDCLGGSYGSCWRNGSSDGADTVQVNPEEEIVFPVS